MLIKTILKASVFFLCVSLGVSAFACHGNGWYITIHNGGVEDFKIQNLVGKDWCTDDFSNGVTISQGETKRLYTQSESAVGGINNYLNFSLVSATRTINFQVINNDNGDEYSINAQLEPNPPAYPNGGSTFSSTLSNPGKYLQAIINIDNGGSGCQIDSALVPFCVDFWNG